MKRRVATALKSSLLRVGLCAALVTAFSAHASAAPTTLTGYDNVSVSFETPQRIVVLNASTYEILQDLGEAARVVGADSATHALIPGAKEKKIPNFGHHAQPTLEAIIASQPDLVLANAGVLQASAPTQLRAAGLKVLMLEPSAHEGIAGLKRRVAAVAAALGKPAAGDTLIKKIDAQLAAVEADNAKISKKKKVFFLYAHGTAIYGGTVGTRWLIDLAGAHDTASAITGTKPISPEALIQAAPEALVLLERTVETFGGIDAVLALPGVNLTPAGRAHAVHVVDNGVPWIGTRFLDHVQKLHRELYPESR